jgi:transcriptional regulator with PAS, ATPase and Fis domain
MNEEYSNSLEIEIDDYIGKNVTDIIPDSRMPLIIETGKEDVAAFFTLKTGQTVLVNRIPIIKDGEVLGAIGLTAFAHLGEIESLHKRILDLSDESRNYRAELQALRGAKYSINQIYSADAKILQLKDVLKKASQTRSTVLISGESGTGKELFAHAIHHLSPRRHFPFIRLNCAAIPENLIEAELFGYEEGSFTGAKKGGSLGKFELANNGSLLLDEINSLPLGLQSKLLRVIQEKELQKVGSSNPIEVDVRLIFTSNRDLMELVQEGAFREDLYYRINVVEIKIPPLRERMGDIPLLVANLIPKLNMELGLNITGVEPGVIDLFSRYSWPGNIRELENCLERGFNSALTGELKLEHFDFLHPRAGIYPAPESANHLSLRESKETAEKKAILHALKQANGNKKLAAEMLEIDRSVLYDKIKKYQIEN